MDENTNPLDEFLGAAGVNEAQAELEADTNEPAPQEAAKPEPEPAPQEAAKPEPEPATQEAPEDKRVPLAALHEERRKRQELQAKLEAYERAIQEAQQQYDNQNTDPAQKLEQQQQELQAQQAALQEQLAQMRVLDEYRRSAQAAGEGFQPAYQHLLRARDAELRALGVLDDAQRMQALQQEEFALAQMAIQNGRNPAELIMELAKARGYQNRGEAQAEVRKAGLEAAKTVAQATKAPSENADDAESLLNIDDDEEFNRAWSKLMK